MKFSEFIRAEYKSTGDVNMKFYKMDNLCKLGYIAALKILNGFRFDCKTTEIALILCNKSASLDSDKKHQNIIDTLPTEEVSPAIFVYTLANIVAGEIAIKHKIQGETTFFINSNYDEHFILDYSKSLLNKGMKYVIFGWCELLDEEYELDIKILAAK